MSPEQARGEPVDHRTDLFALGVLLYEALTGRSPFAAENALATLNRVIHLQQEPVHTLRPQVPEALSALVDDLLQKEPALRPQSAGQVRRELEAMEPATSSNSRTWQSSTPAVRTAVESSMWAARSRAAATRTARR